MPSLRPQKQIYILPYHIFVEIFMFLSGFSDALTYNFRHHFYFYDYLAVCNVNSVVRSLQTLELILLPLIRTNKDARAPSSVCIF